MLPGVTRCHNPTKCAHFRKESAQSAAAKKPSSETERSVPDYYCSVVSPAILGSTYKPIG